MVIVLAVPANGGSSSAATDAGDQPLDRGSIQFLLNGGSDGWMSAFYFPPHGDRTRYQQQYGQNPGPSRDADPSGSMNDGPMDTPVFDSLMHDNPFVDLFNGPILGFSGFPNPFEFTSGLTLPLESVSDVPELPYVADLAQSIATCSHRVLGESNPKAQEEIVANLTFLLASTRVPKFLDMYFRLWHPNCRIVHPGSFDPETVRKPLLAAVIFMGALYSNDEYESYAAKTLLDFVEIFCFSEAIFSKDTEIVRTFTGASSTGPELDDGDMLQDLQGCFTMVVIQYWAGNRTAKARAVDSHLTDMVKIARRMGLPKAQQLPEDRITERAWLIKETKIRLMHFIVLVDCAYSFFQNYPCRLIPAELECDFPCEEHIFDSPHPYSEPNFSFSRGLKVHDVFSRLFQEPTDRPSSSGHHTRVRASSTTVGFKLTLFDTFVLIHLLYVHTNTYMNLTTLLKLPSSRFREHDPTLAAMKRALLVWRDLHMELRAKMTEQEFTSLPFWKNGYNYWLVTHLLISKKDKLDVVMRMDISEDKLEKLRLLLQDES
ncbi:hypothetical protein MBLNU459_g3968t1 [Dothideomycetes sp. NU459]